MIYTMTLNPALDYVMHPNTLDMGFTNRSSSEELHCGGNGINVSTLLNELDKVTVAMGIVGGFTGEYLLSDLQRQGIPSNFVKLDSGFTRINVKLNGIVMTMVNGNGPRIPEKKVDELLERMDVVGAGGHPGSYRFYSKLTSRGYLHSPYGSACWSRYSVCC